MSDWLEVLTTGPQTAGADADAGATAAAANPAAPGWLALLDASEDDAVRFREAPLFGGAGADRLEPEPAPEPEPAAPAPEPAAPDPAPDPIAEAHARGLAEGLAAGRAAAEADNAALLARQRALRLTLRTLDEAAAAVLAEDLAATVLALCEGVLGEAALDPQGLRARCKAAAARIGGAADALVLHLHPDDIALMEDSAPGPLRFAPDPALERGSVVIAGPDGSIADGPAEWRRAIAAAVRG